MKNILIIGGLYIDAFADISSDLRIGETISTRAFNSSVGGAGLLAMAVSKLNGGSHILGAVGNDDFGKVISIRLEEMGVNTSGLVRCEAHTGVRTHIRQAYGKTIIEESGANKKFSVHMVDDNRHLFETADFVIIQPDIPPTALLYAVKLAKACGCRVLLNPYSDIKLPDSLYNYIDIIICNEREAQYLARTNDTDKALRLLKSFGPEQVIITLGSKGCIYNVYGNKAKCPAFTNRTVDRNGVGAAFVAAYSTIATDKHHENDSVEFASLVASITVSGKGGIESIPETEEIMKRINS